jgi:hypothetical protein
MSAVARAAWAADDDGGAGQELSARYRVLNCSVSTDVRTNLAQLGLNYAALLRDGAYATLDPTAAAKGPAATRTSLD